MTTHTILTKLREEVRFTIFTMNSVEEFAEKCGLCRKTIYNFLNESKTPSMRTVAKICNGLGMAKICNDLGIDFKTFL